MRRHHEPANSNQAPLGKTAGHLAQDNPDLLPFPQMLDACLATIDAILAKDFGRIT